MKNKGFTLMELLAVIVILAIIALIATPIILNIIKNSKEESEKRSIEMYADSLKNSIAKYQLSGKKLEVNKLETTDGRNFANIENFKVEYDGNVVCKIIEVYEDGNIYLDKCKVNDSVKEYKYGKKQLTSISFAEDSWETIAENVKAGNLTNYKVGDKKTIKLNGEQDIAGEYTVRIANLSTPSECNDAGFSQTACGFVVEFEDIIIKRAMNSTATNVGGWKASAMRIYLNEENDYTAGNIYRSLPEDLQKVIIETRVISSHGSTIGETNFTTTDKLYLLSTKEVWGKEGTLNVISDDTAESETRQLDYYEQIGVTTNDNTGAIKNYNQKAICWWLRSAHFSHNTFFFAVPNSSNFWIIDSATNETYGVAPAFRIG